MQRKVLCKGMTGKMRTKQWEDRDGALLIHHVGTEGGTALLPGPGWVGGDVGGRWGRGGRGIIFWIKCVAF